MTVTITENDTATFSVSGPSSVAEGAGTATYSVSLSAQPGADVSVKYGTSDGSAASGSDYSSSSGTLTFTPSNWDTAQTVSVSITDDSSSESDETFTLALSEATGGSAVSTTASSVATTITDNDESTPTKVTNLQVSPGNGSLNVSWTAASEAPHGYSVRWRVRGQGLLSPINEVDGTSFTIPNLTNGTTYVVRVDTRNAADNGVHPGTNVVALGTPVGLVLSVTSLTVPEGGSGTYTVKLTSQPTSNVTVTVGGASGDVSVDTNGGASGNQNTLTFTSSNWSTARTVRVSAAEDDDAAADAAVTLGHSVTGGDYGSVTVTITENDTATFSVAGPSSVAEGAGTATYSVSLSAQPGADVSVKYGTSDGSAASGSDYSSSSGTLTFTPSNWDTAQTVSVSITDDSSSESDETFTLALSEATGGSAVSTTASSVATTITDNDESTPTKVTNLQVSPGNGSLNVSWTAASEAPHGYSVRWRVRGQGLLSPVNEVDGTSFTIPNLTNGTTYVVRVDTRNAADNGVHPGTNVVALGTPVGLVLSVTSLTVPEGGSGTYTVKLTSQPTSNVTVTVGGASGDVTVDTNGGTSGNQNTLTFTSSNWSTARTVRVSAAEDDDAAADAAVTLGHSVTGGDYGSVTVTITENDTATFSVAGPSSVAEGAGTATYSVSLSAQPGADVTVKYGTSDGSAASGSDYSSSSGTLTFTPSNWDTAQTVSVSITDDSSSESDETFTLALSEATGGSAVSTTASSVATTITDDDESTPTKVTNLQVSPGNGSLNVSWTAASEAPHGYSVRWRVRGQGLLSPVNEVDGTSFTIPNLTNGTTYVVRVDTRNAADNGVQPGTNVVALGTPVGLVLSVTSLTVPEGGSRTYTLKLTSQPTGNVTVTVGGASGDVSVDTNGGASGNQNTLTFTSSNWDTARTVRVSAAEDDDAAADAAVTLGHSVTGGDYGSVTVTITENDTATFSVAGPSSVAEGAGTATYSVSLSARPGGNVTVKYGTSDGSAASGSDYSSSSGTLTFTPSNWNTAQTVSVSITDDSSSESDETFTLALSEATGGSAVSATASSVETTITDNDDSTPTKVTNLQVSPGNGSLNVSWTAASAAPNGYSVRWRARGQGLLSPINEVDGTSFTIPNLTNGRTYVVRVDTRNAADNGVHPGTNVVVLGTPVGTAAFNVNGPSSVGEGAGTARYRVSLTSRPVAAVTVKYATSNGTAEAGTDYASASGTLTFTPSNWNRAQTVSVPIMDDSVGESDETVSLSLDTLPAAGLPPGSTSVVTTITDNDTARSGLVAIEGVHAGDGALTVVWAPPSDVSAADVVGYEVRYIESGVDHGVDSNWTTVYVPWTFGPLEHAIDGLRNGTSYDVQVRVRASVVGAWSSVMLGVPVGAGVRALPLDVPLSGTIRDGGSAVDTYSLVLRERTNLVLHTRGALPTVGKLFNSVGELVASGRPDVWLGEGEHGFVIADTLEAETYLLEVESSGSAAGDYMIEAAVDSSGGRKISPEGEVGVIGEDELGAAADDGDVYSFSVPSAREVIIRSVSAFDTVGEIRGPDGRTVLASSDDGLLPNAPRAFLLRVRLEAGDYQVRVRFDAAEGEGGAYLLRVDEVRAPGSSRAEALGLVPGEVAGGRFDSSSDEDWFRFTLAEESSVIGRVLSRTTELDGVLYDSSFRAADALWYEQTSYAAGGLTLVDRLSAGTYYLKVRGSSAGGYALQIDTDGSNIVESCLGSEASSPFSDPLSSCQWRLRNTGAFESTLAGEDIDVPSVWASGNKGEGVSVAVVDDGLDEQHPDLARNVHAGRGHDYTGAGDLLHPLARHGTAVAGIIAARDDNVGIRGVAPRARIHGYNLLRRFSTTNLVDAMTRHVGATAVSNNSWGSPDGPGLSGASRSWEMAIDRGVETGWGGKGVVYVWAGGNGGRLAPSGGENGDNSNLDGHANYYGVTAVCAVDGRGQRADYSERGANLWVCAPSDDGAGLALVTTDNYGRHGLFGGTSAAAATVSGVVALMRAANPDLSWRDVKLILAGSARRNDATSQGWATGALQYGSSGKRYSFHHDYGFGVVDAREAVGLADGWSGAPALRQTVPVLATVNHAIPDAGADGTGSRVESTATVGRGVGFVEFIEVDATFNADAFRDLDVRLTSPSGAVSILSVPYAQGDGTRYPLKGAFRFGSSRHLGEDPAGVWTLRVVDEVNGGGTNILESWSMKVYGHDPDEVAMVPGAPGIASVRSGDGSLAVSWRAPAATGSSAITSYDLRYRLSAVGSRSGGDWTERRGVWAGGPPRYELTGLTNGNAYEVQLRAVNSAGAGAWSTAGGGTPTGGRGVDDGDGEDGGEDAGDGGGSSPPRALIRLDADCPDDLCHAVTGRPVVFEDASTGVRSREWQFGDGARSRAATVSHSWSTPGFYEVTLTVSDGTVESRASRVFLVVASEPVGACVADEGTLCSQDSRFATTVDWWTLEGETGAGTVVRSGTNDSGMFWFYSRDNWEVLVKVLNGCQVNGAVWVFAGSTTDVGYRIAVEDTVTGAVREYRNEAGQAAAAVTDTGAFPGGCVTGRVASSLATSVAQWGPMEEAPSVADVPRAELDRQDEQDGQDGCTDSATSLCLRDGRYTVTVDWSTSAGEFGPGRVVSAKSVDSGLFYFFEPGNWEMLVKVLDGCAFNERHWVFAASATDLGLNLVVRDTETGAVRSYTKEPGKAAPALVDVGAFPDSCRP